MNSIRIVCKITFEDYAVGMTYDNYVEPISVVKHMGILTSYDITHKLDNETAGAPFIASVGNDRSIRISYLRPYIDEEEDEEGEDGENDTVTIAAATATVGAAAVNTSAVADNDDDSITDEADIIIEGVTRKILHGHTGRDGHPGHIDKVNKVKFIYSNNITYIITCSDDMTIKRFAFSDDKLLKVRTYEGHHNDYINCLDVLLEGSVGSNGNTYIISGSYDGVIHIYNWNEAQPTATFRHEKKLFCLLSFQDSLLCGSGSNAYVYNIHSKQQKYKFVKHKLPIVSINVCKGDYDIRVLLGSDDKCISIWNYNTGDCIGLLHVTTPVYALCTYFNDDIPLIIFGMSHVCIHI